MATTSVTPQAPIDQAELLKDVPEGNWAAVNFKEAKVLLHDADPEVVLRRARKLSPDEPFSLIHKPALSGEWNRT